MKRRWLVIGLVSLAAGGATYVMRSRRHQPVIAHVDPGPLFVGNIEPAAGMQCHAHGPTPSGQKFTIGARNFYVWGPRDDGKPKPIVLAFHGWGSDGRGLETWFGLERYVDGGYVVYPDSDGDNWDYDGNDDIDFVAAILQKMAATYCVDTTRVMALGFSYGGRFVNHLACKRPELVRGIVVAGSRWDSDETKCVGPVPVLVVHRTHDETMPIAGGIDAAKRWSAIDGCTSTTPISNGCIASTGCTAGAVTYCEDTFFDPEWPKSWNHTMRESYELLAWRWFEQLR